MAEVAARHRAAREPRAEPGFLGVGWSPAVERRPRRGERCGRCGTAPGLPADRIPEGIFCLACLAFSPAAEAAIPFAHHPPADRGRADRAPAPRLTRADRRVVGANAHGRVWLAMLDAERSGDRGRAARYRLWLALYRDRDLGDDELARWADGEGV